MNIDINSIEQLLGVIKQFGGADNGSSRAQQLSALSSLLSANGNFEKLAPFLNGNLDISALSGGNDNLSQLLPLLQGLTKNGDKADFLKNLGQTNDATLQTILTLMNQTAKNNAPTKVEAKVFGVAPIADLASGDTIYSIVRFFGKPF